jgi:hypothetical protein
LPKFFSRKEDLPVAGKQEDGGLGWVRRAQALSRVELWEWRVAWCEASDVVEVRRWATMEVRE